MKYEMEQYYILGEGRMEYQYKIIVSNKNLYKEFEIPEEIQCIRIGTTSLCDFRLNPDYFFEDMEIVLEKKDVWTILCNDNFYIRRDNVRKIYYDELSHGDLIDICYSNSSEKAIQLRFLINFETKIPRFNWKVDISNSNKIKFSDDISANVHILSSFTKNSEFDIYKENNKYFINPIRSGFDICLNGQNILKKTELKNLDFISIADFMCFFKNGCIYLDMHNVTIRGLTSTPVVDVSNSFKYPLFNRNTRIKYQLNNEKIPILVPPSKPKKPEDNLALTLLPALAMLILVIVVRGFMSKSSNNTFIIFSVCSMAMGIITSIASFIGTRKKYKKSCEDRIVQYQKYIDKKCIEVEEAREKEKSILDRMYRNVDENIENIFTFNENLFDRTREDPDYLNIYLGRGKVESSRKIDYKKPEAFESNDELIEIPDKITKKYRYIENSPVIVDLRKAGAIGIVGDNSNNYEFLKNIVIDIISRHYYSDVKLVMLLPEESQATMWAKYIPHIKSDMGTRNIVYNKASKDNVFELLYKTLTIRSNLKDTSELETIVVIVLEDWGIKSHPISRFLDQASELNVDFIFFEEHSEQLPQNCNNIIKLQTQTSGILYNSENGTDGVDFSYETISDKRLYDACRQLWPIHCEEISLESTLRKSISLFELLNIYSVNDIDIKKRWEQSKVYESMAAPLGVNSKNEIVYLNLHEKAHGPHGLVAGTTGSGKSEILQTYILAMATLFHPYEVGFVIIDFKGGGMVNQFKDLPHLNGAITNIDGREINRSLKSIKAELLKRQNLFAEANVNHIDKYIRLYKNGSVEIPLPHLIIIVDEFAELKAEQPEFMKELISAARIGRSLGVHLILATQKPSGQVNEQIWSNSKFKLCLKVQSKEDSNEVLKSPLAAEIKEPGRAYLQVGNNEVFELLQSGYSGEQEKSDDLKQKEFIISEVDLSGKRTIVFEQKKKKDRNKNRTQLEAIVDFVHEYCEKQNIVKLKSICLPALEDRILITSQINKSQKNNIAVGIYDDPDSQYQGPAQFDFCEQNTMIIGASGTGKTNLIQVLIRQFCSQFSPNEINFYILDFGAMYLKNYEALNHIGGVVTISEEERLKNLFKLILEEIQLRKNKFADIGISSYTAYVEAGYTDYPQIILVIDNFAAFKELYADEYEEQLIFITREGLTCGISCIVTNVQTNGLGYKYMSNFANKIALHCNDSGEYSNLFERCRMEPKDVPGRALCSINKQLYEMQTYLAFEGVKEIDRSNAIKKFIEQINNKYEDAHAKLIPSIPEILDYQYLERNYRYQFMNRQYPIGLDYANVDIVTLDLETITEFCVVGADYKLRSNAVKSILVSLMENILFAELRIFIIDDVQRSLKKESELPCIENYSIDYSLIGEWLLNIEEEMAKRYEVLLEEGIEVIRELPFILVLINNKDAIEYISKTKDVLESYNKIVQKYKALGVSFIFSDIEDASVPYGAPELLKRFKEQKRGLLLTKNLKEVKFCDVPVAIARKMKPLDLGDAYLLNGSTVDRIKLLEVENE